MSDEQKLAYGKEIFKGKCPYTAKKCKKWTCDTCEVEIAEREWMEELDESEESEAEE